MGKVARGLGALAHLGPSATQKPEPARTSRHQETGRGQPPAQPGGGPEADEQRHAIHDPPG